MAKQAQQDISKSFSEALQGSAEKSYAQAVKALSAKNLEKTAVTAMADKNPNISPREFKANITALINEVHASNIKNAEKSGDARKIKDATTKRDADIDLFKDTLKSPEFKKQVSEAKGTLNKYLESIVGKDATKRLNDVKYATGPLDAVWVAATGSLQAGAHALGTVALSQIKDLQAGLSGGAFAMTKSMTSGFTDAISKSLPLVGGILGGFVDLFIQSAQMMYDWQVKQNKASLRGAAVTGGKEGSTLNLADLNEATAIPRDMAEQAASALAQVGLGGGEYNKSFNAAESHPDAIQHTATGELYNQATKYLGGNYAQAGSMAAAIKQGYGTDGAEAVLRLNGLLRETEKLAFNSGINAQVFGTSMAGAAAETRFAHLGAGMLEKNMEEMVKSKSALGNLGFDLQSSLPEMTKTLTGLNKSISESQAAMIGYKMAEKSGGDTGDVLGNMYRVRYGKEAYNKMNVTSEGRVMAEKGTDFNSGNISADIIDTVRDEIAENIKKSGMTNKGEILKMAEGVLKAYTNLDLSSAAGAQIIAGNTSSEELAASGKFKAETSSTQDLARLTLESAQRQEKFQGTIVKIVMVISSLVMGGFATLGRGIMNLLMALPGSTAANLAASMAPAYAKGGTLSGVSLTGAGNSAMQKLPGYMKALSAETGTNFSTAVDDVLGGATDAGVKKEDERSAGIAVINKKYDALVNAEKLKHQIIPGWVFNDRAPEFAVLEQQRQAEIDALTKSTPLTDKHSGGAFGGVAKVLSNEYFTPASHHSGGVMGDGNGSFTFDTKSLKTGEMMAFTPQNTQYKVETPAQYSKSNGQNGPIYNMNFSISGVASISDIVNTFTSALNKAIG